MEAFAAAVDLGYRYLETDVHLTRDGVVLAFHDDRLDRVTDGAGLIRSLTAAQACAADAGYHWSGDGGATFPWRGRGLCIPRLEQVLLRWPEVRVNIDVKSDAVVAPLVELVARLEAWDRVCVGAFSDRRLREVRFLSGGRLCTSMGPRAAATARLAAYTGRMPRRGADCLQVPVRHGRITVVDSRLVSAAHRAGLPVHVWTIDDAAEMERLLDLGVDGIMTDRPRLLREVLQRRGQWRDGDR